MTSSELEGRAEEREILRVGDKREGRRDQVVIEQAVAIEVNGHPAALLMALPGDEEELAAGFVLSEGLVRRREELLLVRVCRGGEEPLLVKVVVPADLLERSKELKPVVRYACGTVGRTLAALPPEPLGDGPVFSSQRLRDCYRRLSEAPVFRATGATHAAAVFDRQGELVVMREDVGRHNALDKVIGHCFLKGISLEECALVTTGRASSELVLKTVMARAPLLAALSAPTALGVHWAEAYGLTLVGFLKPRRFNLYAHPERIGD
jgi:FdhD protein